jgi:hypothetical protein
MLESMIYCRKTLFGGGPKLTAAQRRIEISVQSGQILILTCNLVPCNTISFIKKLQNSLDKAIT